MAKCGAKTNAGGTCQRPGMPNGRCHVHGGKSPGGPLTAGGRHSKFLPIRLAARFEEARRDPELISLSAEVALIDTRLGEVLDRLDTTESSAAWAKLAAARQKEKAAASLADQAAASRQLDDLIEAGLTDTASWQEIAALIEQRRKCAESEVKRLAARDQFITAKEANVLMAAIIHIVTQHVPDPAIRSQIAAGLADLAHAVN